MREEAGMNTRCQVKEDLDGNKTELYRIKLNFASKQASKQRKLHTHTRNQPRKEGSDLEKGGESKEKQDA